MGNNCDKIEDQLTKTLQKQSRSEIMTMNDVETIANGIKNSYNENVIACVKTMRQLLSTSSLPDTNLIERIVEQNVIPNCVRLLDSLHHPELLYETTWLLLNIATGSDDITRTIRNSGGIPKLIKLLENNNQKIKEVAAWALSNISCDGHVLTSSNIIDNILLILNDINSSIQTLRVTIWLCTNLCSNHKVYSHVQPLLGPLINLLENDDFKITKNSAQAIRHILRDTHSIRDALNMDLLNKINHLLKSSNKTVAYQGTLILGTISRAGSMSEIDQIFENYEFSMSFLELVKSDNVACVKELLWVLYKIMSRASTLTIRDFATSFNIFEILRNLLTWNEPNISNVLNMIMDHLRSLSSVTYLAIEE